MGKGTNSRIVAVLQGLLASLTGGSLILFAVFAATMGLSGPQSPTPSVTGGGRDSGGTVVVQGVPRERRGGTGTGTRISGPNPTPTAPSTGSPATPAPAVPSGTITVASTGAGFGLQVPSFLTPGSGGTAPPSAGGPTLTPGAFTPRGTDELPDVLQRRFRAGNSLGTGVLDKGERRAVRRVLRLVRGNSRVERLTYKRLAKAAGKELRKYLAKNAGRRLHRPAKASGNHLDHTAPPAIGTTKNKATKRSTPHSSKRKSDRSSVGAGSKSAGSGGKDKSKDKKSTHKESKSTAPKKSKTTKNGGGGGGGGDDDDDDSHDSNDDSQDDGDD